MFDVQFSMLNVQWSNITRYAFCFALLCGLAFKTPAAGSQDCISLGPV
jgi:hypothetical protein